MIVANGVGRQDGYALQSAPQSWPGMQPQVSSFGYERYTPTARPIDGGATADAQPGIIAQVWQAIKDFFSRLFGNKTTTTAITATPVPATLTLPNTGLVPPPVPPVAPPAPPPPPPPPPAPPVSTPVGTPGVSTVGQPTTTTAGQTPVADVANAPAAKQLLIAALTDYQKAIADLSKRNSDMMIVTMSGQMGNGSNSVVSLLPGLMVPYGVRLITIAGLGREPNATEMARWTAMFNDPAQGSNAVMNDAVKSAQAARLAETDGSEAARTKIASEMQSKLVWGILPPAPPAAPVTGFSPAPPPVKP